MNDALRHRDQLYIGGSWVAPKHLVPAIEVIDSSTGGRLGEVPAGSAADIDRAVRAARSGLAAWSAYSPAERADVLEALRDELGRRGAEIADLISLEVGSPRNIAQKVQVGLPQATLTGFANAARNFEWEREVGNSLVVHEPIGVVAAITPWNYPLHQLIGKVGGALAAGATVVVKPASEAPLSAFALADAIHAIGVPAGVFNVVSGEGRNVGEALAGHPDVDLVSFTGSTPVGSHIAKLAAEHTTRVSLELGGKSASIIFEDADIERAVKSSVGNAFLNSGQTCSAWTRLLVPRHLLSRVEELAVMAASKLRLGHPLADGTRLGPLVSEAQQAKVRAHIVRGSADGARLIIGGAEQPADLPEGFYVLPTIFSDVDNASALGQEEIFGPVLSIIPFDTEDEAIAIANDSPYGLAGGVWSGDVDRALSAARRIHSGQIDINGGAFNPVAPFGGVKASGYGREFGAFGIEEFTALKGIQR